MGSCELLHSRAHIWVVVVLVGNWCSAHNTPSAKSDSTQRGGSQAKEMAAQAKLTPEKERGVRLLKVAEAQAIGLEPDIRAFVLWRVSYAYSRLDPKKAERLAKDSFVAAQTIEDPPDHDQCGSIGGAGDIKSWIEERVLEEMIRK